MSTAPETELETGTSKCLEACRPARATSSTLHGIFVLQMCTQERGKERYDTATSLPWSRKTQVEVPLAGCRAVYVRLVVIAVPLLGEAAGAAADAS